MYGGVPGVSLGASLGGLGDSLGILEGHSGGVPRGCPWGGSGVRWGGLGVIQGLFCLF